MKNLVYFVTLCSLLSSCIKEYEQPAPKVMKPVDYLVGHYNVYAPEWDIWYPMEVRAIYTDLDYDTIVVYNFLNLFPILKKNYVQVLHNGHYLYFNLGFMGPRFDKNGKRWNIYREGDNLNTPITDNYLINDTIFIYYSTSDITYCIQDSVPCEGIVYREHIAVKIK